MNYNNAKIYKIESAQTDKVYIGSTTKKYLSDRLAGHNHQMKQWKDGKHNYMSSFEIIKFDDHKILLLESYPCNSIDELRSREAYFIKKNNCINRYIPGRTSNQYYTENKVEISAQRKEKYAENKEHILENVKTYREANNEKIKLRKTKLDSCICGSTYQHDKKTRHENTAKHIKFVENMIIPHWIF